MNQSEDTKVSPTCDRHNSGKENKKLNRTRVSYLDRQLSFYTIQMADKGSRPSRTKTDRPDRDKEDRGGYTDLPKGSSENYSGWRALFTYPSDLVFTQLTSRHESRRKSFFTERQCILTNTFQVSAICIQSYLICNTGYMSFLYFDIVSNSSQ